MSAAMLRRSWLAAALACGCHGDPTGAPPAILLITVDTWRADHFDDAHTPALAALAAEGWRFENAFTPIGLTSPAHASLMTGLFPWEHGMRANNHHGSELACNQSTLAERCRDSGWRTAAFVSAWPAGPAGGLDQGFEVFDGPEEGERAGDVAVEKAIGWLGTIPKKSSFFLWVHVYEPHGPYAPPEEDAVAMGASAGERDRYGAEVHAADRMLAPLLGAAGRRHPFVAVTSDHGEVLDEEPCSWQHERSLHEAVLRVPLAIAGPGIAPAEREAWVGLVDVAPTLLALAGLPALPGVSGRTLVEAVEGRPTWPAESGLCEPDCAPGCAPPGLAGRDRALIGPTWRIVERPGRGGWAEGEGAPLPADWPALLGAITPVPEIAVQPDSEAQEAAEALGYAR